MKLQTSFKSIKFMYQVIQLVITLIPISKSYETNNLINPNFQPYSKFNDRIVKQSSNGEKLVILPLIPHHVLKDRKLREMGINPNSDEYKYYSRKMDNMERHLQSNPKLLRRLKNTSDNSADENEEVSGLFQGYGTHYVDLWVGTPIPQRQTVIVDTGSGVTAFPCSSCSKNCGDGYHIDKFFNEEESSTFQKLDCDNCKFSGYCMGSGDSKQCKISVSYQEGSSWSAFEAVDTTYLGGLHDAPLNNDNTKNDPFKISTRFHGEDPYDASDFKFDMTFGCQYQITGLFITQLADGIMGLCLEPGAIWKQMYDQQMISSRKFSLCFFRANDADSEGSPAGAITMGGTDNALHLTPMVFAKGNTSSGIFHGVRIRKVYLMESGQYSPSEATPDNTIVVSDDMQKLNSGRVIVDSGTTDTYMISSIANTFKQIYHQLTGIQYNTNGMALSEDDIDNIPSIIIQLVGNEGVGEPTFDPESPVKTPGLAGVLDSDNPNDVLLVLTPNHYFEYDADAKKYFPRFFLTESSGTVIGANSMQGHDVMFDIPDNSRIGFAISECNYDTLISPNGETEAPTSSLSVSIPTGSPVAETTNEPTISETSSSPESQSGSNGVVDKTTPSPTATETTNEPTISETSSSPESQSGSNGVVDKATPSPTATNIMKPSPKPVDEMKSHSSDSSDSKDSYDSWDDNYYDHESVSTSSTYSFQVMVDSCESRECQLTVGFVVVIVAFIFVFTVYRLRRGRVRYHRTGTHISASDDLDDLYLDTEIQRPRNID